MFVFYSMHILFVCTRGVHMFCTGVSVNKYYCTYVLLHLCCEHMTSLFLAYFNICYMLNVLHSYSCCFYMWVVNTCVHHKEVHHISLYKYYDDIRCDIVSKHVGVI